MPMNENSHTRVTGFNVIPPFAKGAVRDLRIRWALEEIARDYSPQLFNAFEKRPEDYRAWQPFGQVPAFDDGEHRLFESGAILLYLGEQDARLLPVDPVERWRAVSWLIAALNSVEPMIMQVVSLDFFQAREPWAKEARPAAVEMARSRLKSTEKALGENEWFAGPFSIADIMMVTVLRNLNHTDILDEFPALATYKSRGEDRPAFRRAYEDQMSGYAEPVGQEA